jgi:hypothetical protein
MFSFARQTESDHKRTAQRVRQCGPAFDMMKRELAEWSKEGLVFEAGKHCDTAPPGQVIPRLQRLEKRYRDALIAWYCQHWPNVRTAEFTTKPSPRLVGANPQAPLAEKPNTLTPALTVKEGAASWQWDATYCPVDDVPDDDFEYDSSFCD